MQTGAAFLNLLFPNLCPGCNLPLRTSNFPICPTCTYHLERVDEQVAKASVCKLPGACNAFKHIFSLWYFDKAGTVQHIHRGLKYNNRPYYGSALGKLIGVTFLLPLHPRHHPELIIPIPLHRKRLLERGYNQSDVLAAGISRVAHLPYTTTVLRRPIYTKTQTGLDSLKRLQNVASAFRVAHPEKIKDRHILLVDDVLTTGATLFAAAQPLKDAGAREISVATLAMARP